MNNKKQHPIFIESLTGTLLVIFIGIVILIRGTKDKERFERVTGKVTYLETSFENLPIRNSGKYRYLSVDTYPKMFELFIGNDFTDFKPDFERINTLRTGDEIVIYFDEDENEKDLRLNRLAQFIDRKGEPIFMRGSKDKYGGYLLIIAGVFLSGVIIYFKKTGRIV